MFITKILGEIGSYMMLMRKVFQRPVKRQVFRRQLFDEMEKLGLNSIGIVAIISVFMGAVVALQMAINLVAVSAQIPDRLCHPRIAHTRVQLHYSGVDTGR